MGVHLDRGRYYFVKRVPKAFAHVDPRAKVNIALQTADRREARARAVEVEAEVVAYWRALAAGLKEDAAARWEAARSLCAARGFPYRPVEALARPEALAELVERVRPLASPTHVAPAAEVEAVLGLVDPPPLKMTEALEEFFKLTRDRVEGKSEGQVRHWQNDRRRAVRYFVEAAGDLPLADIARPEALKFRAWWQARIEAKGGDPETANKSLGHVADVHSTVSDLLALGLDNPFRGLRLKARLHRKKVPPFSVEFLRAKLLAPGALDRMNEEARDALLVMVNTGARPSEIVGALPEDFRVLDNLPHLAVLPRPGRSLKTAQSEREIPLVGVSLEAARRIVARGGFSRYFLKGDGWSAAVNKFLREKGLLETDDHTAYSLRHAFEDRLLEQGTDDRLRAELMGHKYSRPAYGRGGSLAIKARAVEGIAL